MDTAPITSIETLISGLLDVIRKFIQLIEAALSIGWRPWTLG